MSRYKSKKIVPQKLFLDNKSYDYYNNVLISLGLSKFYILYNNYFYFGRNEIDNQDIIKAKFSHIEETYNSFIDRICKKYDCETLVLEFGVIYTKLQKIHLINDDALEHGLNDKEIKKNISYSAKLADLMSRKIKTLSEIVIIKNNHKKDFGFTNFDYKKLIILLYYYSIYIFYDSKSKLSKYYENGVTNFYIFPKSLEPICTAILGQNNSVNDNELRFNYDAKLGEIINYEFDDAFSKEKGISFECYINLMQSIIDSLKKKKQINGRISKAKLYHILKSNYPNIDLDTFENECILKKESFETTENNLYKNNCKHRLDTAPIIDINDKYYLLNEGFLWNSKNFWNNVHSIGLTPYISDKTDKILTSLESIIKNITSLFEQDIIKVFKKIDKDIKIYNNVKSKTIFKDKNIEDNEWDIIAVDYKNKYIFDVEAKFLSTSLTESSLSNDLKKLIGDHNSYKNKFEKRIDIENTNMEEFLNFCDADDNYNIVHIMVTSKVVDLNIQSETRHFLIIHYEGLEYFILNNFLHK